MKSRSQERLVEQRRETVNLVEFRAYHLQFAFFNTSVSRSVSYVL